MSTGNTFECPFGCNAKKTFKKQSSLNAHMGQCSRKSTTQEKLGIKSNQLEFSDRCMPVITGQEPKLHDTHATHNYRGIDTFVDDSDHMEINSFFVRDSKQDQPFESGQEEEEDTATGLSVRCEDDDFCDFDVASVESSHEQYAAAIQNEKEQSTNKSWENICSEQFCLEIQRQQATGVILVNPVSKPKTCRVPSDVALLDLARILDKARCPNYLFDDILSWCKHAGEVGCNPSIDRLPKRKSYFAGLDRRLAIAGMTVPRFYSKSVLLETADIKGDTSGPVESEINYWDFSEQLKSLLSDHSIFGNTDNLNVNGLNPFLPIRESHLSGGWYQDTIKAKGITGFDGNFLVGIVLAADRTGITWNQRYGVEPLLFTLTIIKESLWHQPRVWRPLAMIPCSHDYKGAAAGKLHSNRKLGKGHSSRNYHAYLRVALESIQKVQSPTFLYWPYNGAGKIPSNAMPMYRAAVANKNVHELCRSKPLRNAIPSDTLKGVRTNVILGTNQRVMNVVCCISHIILDGEGADKVTCRHTGDTRVNNRISRSCDCRFAESDDAFVECSPLCQARIIQGYFQTKWSKKYIEQPEGLFEKEMVHAYAVHACENAFWNLDFGYQPNGFYSSLTIDSMHAYEEGNNDRVLVLILGEQGTSNGFCAKVDNVVDLRLRTNVPRQSASRRLPRMSYSRGISSLSHLAAHERVGLMCALTLVSISLESNDGGHIIMGRNAMGCPSERRIAVQDKIVFCQLSLLFHSWVDNGPHELLFMDNSHRSKNANHNMRTIQEAASLLGEYQKMAFPREAGNGHQTQKFHDWYKHILSSIVLAGNGRRIKADVSEKMHKYFCKAPGETALKHSQEIFLRGVCTRLTTTAVLNSTRAILDLDDNGPYDQVGSQLQFTARGVKKTVLSSAHVKLSDKIETSTLIWNSNSSFHTGYDIFVRNMIIHGCHIVRDRNQSCDPIIRIYTELTIDGTVFRCHPNYRKENGPWYDWAMIKWECQMKPRWKVAADLWKPSASAVSSIDAEYREVLLSLHDHLEDCDSFDELNPPQRHSEIDIYVPGRICAFLECSTTGSCEQQIMYAVVESCESECSTDSLITRRWRKMAGPAAKRCVVIEISAISCPCFVVESKPGFPKTSFEETSKKDLVVHEVFDRKTSWGRKFLAVVNRGLSSVCYRDMKGKLDKLLRKNISLSEVPADTDGDDDNDKTGTVASTISREGKRKSSDITHRSQGGTQSETRKKRKTK